MKQFKMKKIKCWPINPMYVTVITTVTRRRGAILLAGGVIRMERGIGPSYYVKQDPAIDSM